MQEEYLKDLKEFVGIQSIKDNYQELLQTVHFIRDYFNHTDNSPFFIQEFECEKVPSIVVSNIDTREFDLILSGHSDVVEAPEDFYSVNLDGDIITGRGTADMKAYVLAMMLVFKELQLSGKLNYSVGLMITTDEEWSGYHGARYLLEEQGYDGRLVHIPDGGKKLHVIEVANKGYLRYHFISHGKPAHSSRPWLGENAINKLMDVLVEIRSLFNEADPNVWQATYSVGTINGGRIVNSVPEFAESLIDIRYTQHEKVEDLDAQIRAIADKHKVEVTQTGYGAEFEIDVESPFVKRYEDSIKKYCDTPIEYYRSEGASDAQYFADKNIPIIVHQADCGDIHTEKEWISLSSLEKYMDILRDYMLSLNEVFAKE